MRKRTCYWYSPNGEFGETKVIYWGDAVAEIPDGAWIFDPDADCPRAQYGKVITQCWHPKLYDQYPNEFKAYLLLLGVC